MRSTRPYPRSPRRIASPWLMATRTAPTTIATLTARRTTDALVASSSHPLRSASVLPGRETLPGVDIGVGIELGPRVPEPRHSEDAVQAAATELAFDSPYGLHRDPVSESDDVVRWPVVRRRIRELSPGSRGSSS